MILQGRLRAIERSARRKTVRTLPGNASLRKEVAEHELLQSQWKISQKEQEVQKRARTAQAWRGVARTRHCCMVVWNTDLPSVLYGRDTQRQNALANTLTDCAAAVSQIH